MTFMLTFMLATTLSPDASKPSASPVPVRIQDLPVLPDGDLGISAGAAHLTRPRRA